MAELEIVVRARDQLTAALRSMGTAVDRLAQQVRTEFDAAGGAVDQVALGLAGAGQAAGTFGTQAGAAAQGAAKLGTVNVDPLRVALTATRVEIDKIAATTPVSPEAVQRMADLEEQARRAEDALIGVGGVDIDIARKVAQAEQAFERLGSEASLVPLQVEIGRARAEVERLRGAAAQAGTAVEGLDRVRIEQLERGIREGESALVRLRNGAGGAAAGARTMGTAFTSAGAAIKGALLPLLPIFGLAGAAFFAKKAADDSLAFTSALGQIRTEGALTAAEIESLGESARATARALGLADADAAPVLLAAVTDGAKDAADGLERYNAALRLSAVTGGDAKRTTDVLTSALNAYARQGLGAARAADVLFEVSRAGKVEIDALAGGLEGVLPLASQLGIGFEELGAVLVTATRQGGGFEQGVQAIRAALGALTSISDEGREALRGIDYSAAAIRARGLVPVLSDISARLKGNSDAIRAVFPDGRSFGALLAVLANDGRDLSDAMAELAGSSGAVEDALGRKLQSPLVQLGIIFNRLRSELGERLGSAFTDAVSRAVATLGGLEAAARKVGDLGAIIGAGLGSGLGVLGEVISDQVERLSLFVESIGGAQTIVQALEQSARTAASAVGVVLVVSREFFAISIDGLEKVRAGWVALLATLSAIPGVDLAIAGLDALIQSPEEARAKVEGLNRELAFLEKGLAQANAQKLKIEPDDTAGLVLINSRIQDFEARISNVKTKIEDVGVALSLAGRADQLFGTDKFGKLEDDLDGLVRLLDGDLSRPRSVEVDLDVKGDIEEQLRAAEERVALFERGLSSLRRQAEQALDGRFSGETLNQFLTILAGQALQGRDGLNEAAEAAAGLRRELAQALRGDLADKRAELDRLKAGLADARSAAELLGEAGKSLDSSFQVDAIAAVEAEIASLQARIDQLVARDFKIKPTFEVPETIVTAGQNDLVLPVQLVAGQQAIADLQRALAGIEPPDVFRQMEERFRGGIEPSLERQANTIDRQVARQRTSLTLLRAMGLLDAGRLAALEQATDELDKQSGALRKQADEIRKTDRLEAIALGIDLSKVKDEDLREAINNTQSRLALEAEAAQLGVSFDVNYDPEKLTEAVRIAREKSERAALESQAIELNIAFEGVDNGTLGRLIQDAQNAAQKEAKAFGLKLDALSLGVKFDGRDLADVEAEIKGIFQRAQVFAKANPIIGDALVSGIRGFGNAIGAIASGAQTAKEALSSFFQSFVQQVAGAIAQALLLKAIISAVGGPESGAGAFLKSAFASKDGNVFPAARGMAVPALAAAALAVAPLALGAPVGLAAGGQPVVAFADGGAPSPVVSFAKGETGETVRNGDHHSRIVPLALGAANVTSVTRGVTPPVVAFASGGSPHLDRIVSAPTYAPLASLAGSAVVPLSGGGVETTSGEKLPVKKQGRELVVAAAQGIAAPLYTFAQGGPIALYGEAGPEAIMRTYAAPGGGPGLRMASGGVAPLTRVSGGRLGVALADGGALDRTIRTEVLPFALGGVGNVERTVATRVLPFALGTAQGSPTPARIVPLALGGLPAAASQVLTARPVAPVNISVPVQVNVAGGGPASAAQEDPKQTEARLQAAISTSPRVREAIAAVVSRELEARPSFRANVRGDRA